MSYGETTLARKLDDSAELARVTGTSIGTAKQTVETAKTLADADQAREALKSGDISLDQATEIARAEKANPGSSKDLLKVAGKESFQVLREKSRKVVLEAEQNRGLAQRQKEARGARSYADELGMTHIHLAFEPHVATPIVTRAEAEADRLFRQAKKEGKAEPFERYLADAYAKMLDNKAVKGPSKRPELVVVVSHEVAKRGWKDVKKNEMCKIPGVGPIDPQVAKKIAKDDAFLSGVFFDGKDLREYKRWTPQHPHRGARGPGAGGAAGVRRHQVRRLRQEVPKRDRPRRTGRCCGADVHDQHRSEMLELPLGQNRTGSQGGEIDAPKTWFEARPPAAMRATAAH